MAENAASNNDMLKIMQSLHDAGGKSAQVPAGWTQGRALYGGLVAALAADAMALAVENPRPLRSLMVNFVAPASDGTLNVHASVLREGRSVVQTRADVVSEDGAVYCAASAAFGGSRPGVVVKPNAPKELKPRNSVPALGNNTRPLPSFLGNFDIHWTGGAIPMTGSMDRTTSMWVRHKCDMSAFPAAKIIAIADMPPPIVLSHYSKPAMASSLSWSLEFLVPPEEVLSEWFFLEFELDAAASGYSQQTGSIFDEDGTLVAVSRQCMVYFE
ncbi:thioesterase family protein [Kordiimonas aquimaris]|uniref:thioesterase family protein n=1 Tax=Kordiimonas aquimaris TaxID=707591 RepID=UPI0021D2234A|nr:thioesterase family protein [Kordiimonas aquimaris]